MIQNILLNSVTLATSDNQPNMVLFDIQTAQREKIMALALDYCPDYVADIDVDPDWFQFYCELVQNISTHSMQKLWAKILAGEISNPGSFSLKTHNFLLIFLIRAICAT